MHNHAQRGFFLSNGDLVVCKKHPRGRGPSRKKPRLLQFLSQTSFDIGSMIERRSMKHQLPTSVLGLVCYTANGSTYAGVVFGNPRQTMECRTINLDYDGIYHDVRLLPSKTKRAAKDVSAVAINDGVIYVGTRNMLRMYEAGSGRCIAESPLYPNSGIMAIDITRPNEIVFAGEDGVSIFNVSLRQRTRFEPQHDGSVTALARSPKSTMIVSGGVDGTVWCYMNPSADGAVQLYASPKPIRAVVFSPQGDCIAIGGDDKTIRILSIGTNDAKTSSGVLGHSHVVTCIGHSHAVTCIAFSLDGRIVSGSRDKTVRVWDVKTGTQMGPALMGHKRTITAVSFLPNGCGILSGGLDCKVIQWNSQKNRVIGIRLCVCDRIPLDIWNMIVDMAGIW